MSNEHKRAEEEKTAASAEAVEQNDKSKESESGAAAHQDKKVHHALKQVTEEKKKAEEEAASWKDKALRAMAELENFKKRAVADRARQETLFKATVLEQLIELIDNFERALDHAEKAEDFKTLHDGTTMIHKQLSGILEKYGVTEIPADGQPFDPELHEAFQTEFRDDVAEETVVETLQKGYKVGDKVIRHAKVKVALPPRKDCGCDN